MIQFIPLQEKHFPLLLKWLETSHVKAWWDQDIKWTPDLIKEKYGNYVKGFKPIKVKNQVVEKPVHGFIMCIDGQEVGYIQYYNLYDFLRERREELESLFPSLASIDIFIGEKEWIGKGYGSLLMDKFLKEYVLRHFDAVFVDPETANTHAIRAYEKAGFKKIKTIKEGTITWMIMEQLP